MYLRCKSIRSWCDGSSDRSLMVDPLGYFSFQPVPHDWCNKGRDLCYSLCGMMHIKELLLLIAKSSLCLGSGFPLSLSEWLFTICVTPYNRKYNVSSASLNKIFPPIVCIYFQPRIERTTLSCSLHQSAPCSEKTELVSHVVGHVESK